MEFATYLLIHPRQLRVKQYLTRSRVGEPRCASVLLTLYFNYVSLCLTPGIFCEILDPRPSALCHEYGTGQ